MEKVPGGEENKAAAMEGSVTVKNLDVLKANMERLLESEEHSDL